MAHVVGLIGFISLAPVGVVYYCTRGLLLYAFLLWLFYIVAASLCRIYGRCFFYLLY